MKTLTNKSPVSYMSEDRVRSLIKEAVRREVPGQIREVADQVVRKAIREQAREIELHLKSIHDRLLELESRPPAM